MKTTTPAIVTQVSPAREAEIAYYMALRLFKKRAEVKDDWHFSTRRRNEIRGHIAIFRDYQKRTGDNTRSR
jgi:hypothetical protein